MRRQAKWVGLALLGSLGGCVADVDESESSVVQASETDEAPFKQAASWAGAFSSWAQAAYAVYDFASHYGEATPEEVIQSRLWALYQQSKWLEDLVMRDSMTSPRLVVETALSHVGTASFDSRADLMWAQSHGLTIDPASPASAGYLLQSSSGIDEILNVKTAWSRLANDNWTRGEWWTVTPFRPPVTDGRVWDYRWGLPALLAAVGMRLDVFASVSPSRFAEHGYDPYLIKYRDAIVKARSDIEGRLACGYSVAIEVHGNPIGAPTIKYQPHAICGDPWTGMEETTSFDTEDLRPWEVSLGPYVWIIEDVYAEDWWLEPYAPTSTGITTVGGYRNRFWSQLAENPTINYGLQRAIEVNANKLRARLGLFAMQRVIDSLNVIITHDPGPLSAGRLRSGISNVCLSHHYAWGSDAVVIAPCDDPWHNTPGQTWWWDPTNAVIQNQSTGTCLAISGTSPWRWGQPAILEPCDLDKESQRWSYDPTTKLLRNGAGMVLDIYNGNSTPGTEVWSYVVNGSAAQQWGFRSPWTTTGTGGPF